MHGFAKTMVGLLGICTLIVLGLAVSSHNITAQDGSPTNESNLENGRYQISAWGYTGNSGTATSSGHGKANGAYIIDTRTGKVWAVFSNNKIAEIGSVND